jgi:hypothetical protein
MLYPSRWYLLAKLPVRGTDYFKELKNSISDFNLDDDINITDFIERTDQLLLMKIYRHHSAHLV